MIGKAVGWMGANPGKVIGAAAVLGLFRSHPLRRSVGTSSSMILGDPDARAKIMFAAINKSMATMASPSNNPNSSYGGGAYQQGTGYSPSGSIVLGLYNSRMK